MKLGVGEGGEAEGAAEGRREIAEVESRYGCARTFNKVCELVVRGYRACSARCWYMVGVGVQRRSDGAQR